MSEDTTQTSTVELAAELTIAWLSNPNTRIEAGEVGNVLRQVHDAVKNLGEPEQPEEPGAPEFMPAVSVRKSLASKDHIISMIDGKSYKTLRRHLAGHGLTPDQYRERYGLKKDYPMVSESYSEVRRNMAKQIGLGRKPKEASQGGAAAKAPSKPRGRGRPKKSVEAIRPAEGGAE